MIGGCNSHVCGARGGKSTPDRRVFRSVADSNAAAKCEPEPASQAVLCRNSTFQRPYVSRSLNWNPSDRAPFSTSMKAPGPVRHVRDQQPSAHPLFYDYDFGSTEESPNPNGFLRAITPTPNFSSARNPLALNCLRRPAVTSPSRTVRFHLPKTDNQAAGKLRPGFHPFAVALASAPILDNRTDRQASPGPFPREPRPDRGSRRNGHYRLSGRSSHNRTKPDKTRHPKAHLPPAISHAINTLAPARRLRSRTKIFANTRTSAPKPLSLCAARCTKSHGQPGPCSTVSLREADQPSAPPWARRMCLAGQHEPTPP
jgi:hypothetical protein